MQKYADHDDIVFLAFNPDKEEKLKKFLERKRFDYQLIYVNKGLDLEEKFSETFGTPSNFIINQRR